MTRDRMSDLPRQVKATTRRAARKVKGKPSPFSDSFTTSDACFSVEVKPPWGESVEDIEVKIDCGGTVHGDEDLIDVLIEMLEQAKENLIARRGTRTRLLFTEEHGEIDIKTGAT